MSSGIPDYAPPEDCNLHKQEALCRQQYICKSKASYKDSSLQTYSTIQIVKVTIIFKDHGAFLFQYGNTLIPSCHNYSFGLLDHEN